MTKTGLVNRAKWRLVWAALQLQARLHRIDIGSLGRVERYIRNKFEVNPSFSPDPNQRPFAYFPELTGKPVYDPREFAWTRILEESTAAIKAEFLSLKEQGQFNLHPQMNAVAAAGQWNTYYFYADGGRFDENCRACPATAAALLHLPGATLAGRVFFSLMSPGTHLRPHCGATNARLRCHLGLVTTQSAEMRVADQQVRWQEGRTTVFDDSFEHEVWNPNVERAVLIVDFWHPDLTDNERWALQLLESWSGRGRVYRHDIRKE